MKTDFTKYLKPDHIITVEGKNKLDALQEVITAMVAKSNLDRDELADKVWKREKMMTTGIGQGLGMPHVRIPEYFEPIIIMGVCRKPLKDYKSVDDEPIRLLMFIAAPEGDQENYLKLLGSVSGKLKDHGIIDNIHEAIGKPREILKILRAK